VAIPGVIRKAIKLGCKMLRGKISLKNVGSWGTGAVAVFIQKPHKLKMHRFDEIGSVGSALGQDWVETVRQIWRNACIAASQARASARLALVEPGLRLAEFLLQ